MEWGMFMGYTIQKWITRQFRKPKTIVILLILSLGFIMILLSGGHSIVQGIGISLFASGIVSVVSIFFINDEDPIKTAKAWGLEHVYDTRGEMNASCDAYMARAKTLKAAGFGFRSLRDTKIGALLAILEKGGSVKIITMKPDCEALKLREGDERQQIQKSIEELIQWGKDTVRDHEKYDIQIRFHDHLPPDFMFIMNNRLFAGPYEYDKLSQQTISFEYSITGSAYEYYESYFDRLWNDEKFCSDALR